MNLKELRKSKKLTYRELSSITGLSRSSIFYIENGYVMPWKRTREKIEKALGVEIDWLTPRLNYLANKAKNKDKYLELTKETLNSAIDKVR